MDDFNNYNLKPTLQTDGDTFYPQQYLCQGRLPVTTQRNFNSSKEGQGHHHQKKRTVKYCMPCHAAGQDAALRAIRICIHHPRPHSQHLHASTTKRNRLHWCGLILSRTSFLQLWCDVPWRCGSYSGLGPNPGFLGCGITHTVRYPYPYLYH